MAGATGQNPTAGATGQEPVEAPSPEPLEIPTDNSVPLEQENPSKAHGPEIPSGNHEQKTPDKPKTPGKPRKAKGFIMAGGAVLIAIAAVVVLMVVTSIQNAKPKLTEEDVRNDLSSSMELSLGEMWDKKDTCSLTSVSIDDEQISQDKKGTHLYGDATAVYEGSLIKATCTYCFSYVLEDGAWKLVEYDQTGYTDEPIAAIPDDLLTSCVSSLMNLVDEDPYKDANGDTQKLKDLYSTNLSCSVSQNNTGQDGDGAVMLSISAQRGIRSYSGELEATFGWDDSGWYLVDCSTDEETYEPNLSSFVGTWTGELIDADRSWSYTCYGGRANPLVLTVKSVNADAQTAVVDLTYTLHPHNSGQASVESSPEDVQVTQTDLLIDVKGVSYLYEIYKGTNPINQYVDFGVTEDGLVEMKVESSNGYDRWQMDTYKLTKTSDATS